jgi:hypothetical protein
MGSPTRWRKATICSRRTDAVGQKRKARHPFVIPAAADHEADPDDSGHESSLRRPSADA